MTFIVGITQILQVIIEISNKASKIVSCELYSKTLHSIIKILHVINKILPEIN